MDDSKRQQEGTTAEQSVSRALRDTLPMVQNSANELSHAIEDLVSACGSRRLSNTMPSMLRAQTAAASLAAMLESLLRLVALASQGPRLTPAEELISRAVTLPSPPEPAPPQMPPREIPTPMGAAAPVAVEEPPPPPTLQPEVVIQPPAPAPEPERPAYEPAVAVAEEATYEVPPPGITPQVVEEVAEVRASAEAVAVEAAPVEAAPAVEVAEPPAPAAEPVAEKVHVPAFVVESLPADQQEMHRRANRHAKVSMQDIRLLRPKEVAQGREQHDICTRLKNDLDKARKEYVRRFQPILDHPVDYFRHWCVEILAEGKAEALGEYPYPSPVNRH